MSYANGTTHYNLPQTVGTDKRDWTDTNQAFADIDAAIHTAYETASTGASEIAAIKTTVANLGNAQVTFQHDLDEVELTVGQQGTAITNLDLKVDDVKADAMDMICARDEGTAQIATRAVNKDEYFRYNDVLYIATADIAIGDTIVPNTNCKATNVATVLEEISSGGEVTANDVTYNHTTSGLSATKVQQAIDELKGLIDQIGGGGMPILDRSNPLYTFSETNLTFTTTKECYLELAGFNGGVGTILSVAIDNVIVSTYVRGADGVDAVPRLGIIKVDNGSTITLTLTQGSNYDIKMGVYDLVS